MPQKHPDKQVSEGVST